MPERRPYPSDYQMLMGLAPLLKGGNRDYIEGLATMIGPDGKLAADRIELDQEQAVDRKAERNIAMRSYCENFFPHLKHRAQAKALLDDLGKFLPKWKADTAPPIEARAAALHFILTMNGGSMSGFSPGRIWEILERKD